MYFFFESKKNLLHFTFIGLEASGRTFRSHKRPAIVEPIKMYSDNIVIFINKKTSSIKMQIKLKSAF